MERFEQRRAANAAINRKFNISFLQRAGLYLHRDLGCRQHASFEIPKPPGSFPCPQKKICYIKTTWSAVECTEIFLQLSSLFHTSSASTAVTCQLSPAVCGQDQVVDDVAHSSAAYFCSFSNCKRATPWWWWYYRPLTRDGGAEDPTVRPHPKV